MEQQTFSAFCDLCRNNTDVRHVQEIQEKIATSDVWFSPGVVMEKDHVASLYRFRFTIADKTNPKRKEFYEDYERAVDKIEQSGSSKIGLTALFFESLSFLIFYESDSDKICGILKTRKSDLSPRPEGIPDKTIPLDESPDLQKFSKGQRVN